MSEVKTTPARALFARSFGGVADGWAAQRRGDEPTFKIEANKVGYGYFARAALQHGKTDAIYDFKLARDQPSRLDATS